MNFILSPELTDHLTNCDLTAMEMLPDGSQISLAFSWPGFVEEERNDVTLTLKGVEYLLFSRASDQFDMYFVGGVNVVEVGKDGIITIPDGFPKTPSITIESNVHPLYHLHVERPLLLEVVCGSVEVGDLVTVN